MKSLFSISFLFLILSSNSTFARERTGDLLDCKDVIDVSEHSGQTFLSFMLSTVSPQLNKVAKNGYSIANGEAVKRALGNVSKKVRTKAIQGARGEKNLVELADQLEGQKATLYTLPNKISSVDRSYDRYGLSTFLGLVSCGGAVLKFHDDNYAYNIHYGTGEQAKDERTGRSFGAGPTRTADDASDKAYLTDLEEYVTSDRGISEFYRTLLQALTNTDTANYKKLSDQGQTLLTDFLAVYTAEQARNIMDDKITLHWDAALLEVTLLSAFHAGQKEITLFFKDTNDGEMYFTDKVLNQARCEEPRNRKRQAHLLDYWQFSENVHSKEHCGRSGINITKRQFRALGKAITQYEKENNPGVVEKVEKELRGLKVGENLFEDLSKFLINPKTPKKLGRVGDALADAFTDFLEQVNKDAEEITEGLHKEYPKLK